MKRLLLLLALLVTPLSMHAQTWSGIIDPSRAVNWANVGIPGGIPNRTTICSTLTSTATAATINSAIAACPSGQVVYLSAGTYNLSAGIDFGGTSNVTLRGAGADQTFIVFTGNTGCYGQWSNICIENGDNNWPGSPTNTANWTAGYTPGTTTITLSSVTNLAVGSILILDETADASDPGETIPYICETVGPCAQDGGGPAGGERTNRPQQQFVKVTAISGLNVTISPGLYMPNWRSGQTPGAWWATTEVVNDGLENMSIDGTNGLSDHNITINNGYNCWVKGIRSIDANRDHVNLYATAASVVRDSYFFGTQNGTSQSYGIEAFMGSDNLIENNIFQQVTTPIQVNGSTSGSVYGYNFNINDVYTASAGWMIYGNSLHAAGVDSILFEGNEGNGLIGDNIHGTHNFVTDFRNQYWGWEVTKTAQTSPYYLNFGSRYFNIIGNIVGKPAYHTTYQTNAPGPPTDSSLSIYGLGWFTNKGYGLPADPLVASTLMRWGNYDTVNAAVQWNSAEVPTALTTFSNALPATHTLPASFYYSAKPGWWPVAKAWPPIGPDVTGGNIAGIGGFAYTIPAQDCYTAIGGPADGTGLIRSFNASTCYSSSTGAVAAFSPTSLNFPNTIASSASSASVKQHCANSAFDITITCAFGTNLTSGNTLVMYVHSDDGGTMAASGCVTWTSAATGVINGAEAWFVGPVTATAACTVTGSGGSASNAFYVEVWELAGTLSTVDGTPGFLFDGTSGASITGPSTTTTVVGDMVLATVAHTGNVVVTANSPFTDDSAAVAGTYYATLAHDVDSATGSIAPVFASGGDALNMGTIAIKKATGGGGAGGNSSLSVILTNTGGASMTGVSIAITGTNAADFVVSSTTCTVTLAALASCSITVKFSPSALGARSANISVTDSAPGSPQTVPLSGTGVATGVSGSAFWPIFLGQLEIRITPSGCVIVQQPQL